MADGPLSASVCGNYGRPMSETSVGAPARDRQDDLRKRLAGLDLPKERRIRSELQRIANQRMREVEAAPSRRGLLARFRRPAS
jgi:hypothetical protein